MTIWMATAIASTSVSAPCDQAPATATACVEFAGGIAFTESWAEGWSGSQVQTWEDLTIVCGSACQVTVDRGSSGYRIFDGQQRVLLASETRSLAVVSVFGSRGADLVDISGLGGQTFAHMGDGDDTLHANSCTAITESRGEDAVSCARGAWTAAR